MSISLNVKAEDENLEKLLGLVEREFPSLSWMEREVLLGQAEAWSRLGSIGAYSVNRATITIRAGVPRDTDERFPAKLDADHGLLPH
jgi:hypothetical protein